MKDWGGVALLATILTTVFVAGFGYLAAEIKRLDAKLDSKFDKLTDLYIRHLEKHS